MNQALNFSKPQGKTEYGYYYSAKDFVLSPFCCTELHLFVMDEHVFVISKHLMNKQQHLLDKQKHLLDSKQHLATSSMKDGQEAGKDII